MGQSVNGLLYGVRVDGAWNLLSDDSGNEARGLLSMCPVKGLECDENCNVVGFWVAVRNGDENGVIDLEEPVALDAIATTQPYAKALAKAAKQWAKFSKWAASRSLVMPAPTLWLTVTEVA